MKLLNRMERCFSLNLFLSVCGDNKIIKFWGAVKECQVRAVKDALLGGERW